MTAITKTRARVGALLVALASAALIAACGSGSHSPAADATDRAFVQQMIPHHEMAVEMAAIAKRRGQHTEIRGLAAGIVTSQDDQIAEMKTIARGLGVTPATMPSSGMSSGGAQADRSMTGDARTLGLSMSGMGMSMSMAALPRAHPFDRAFIDEMIPHHQGAIRMARAELARGADRRLKGVARAIIAAQTREIGQMSSWRTRWYGRASPAGGVPRA